MTNSAQLLGVLMIIAAVFASTLLPLEPRTRALTAALILAVGGGTKAFLRSRTTRP